MDGDRSQPPAGGFYVQLEQRMRVQERHSVRLWNADAFSRWFFASLPPLLPALFPTPSPCSL